LLSDFNSKVSHFLRNRHQHISNRLCTHDPLRIHFIDLPAWERQIRFGFRGTKHKLSFGPLTKEVVLKSDLVVPLDMLGVLEANRFKHLLVNQIIPVPDKATALLCDDKKAFNNRALELGYGKYIPKMGSNLKLPFILKKRIAASSAHAYKVLTDQDRNSFQRLFNDSAFFSQEMVPGNAEYATHVLIKNGRIEFDLTLKYLYSGNYPIKGKDVSSTTITRSQHVPLFEKLLNDISYSGLCCFNYKELNGKPMIIEINPRFGGSLCSYFPSALSAAIKAK
jgi:hypothetical protein